MENQTVESQATEKQMEPIEKEDEGRSSSYSNPKQMGAYAYVGDIFQVTSNDSWYNSSLAVGDFYIAQFTGNTLGRHYPAWNQNNGDWHHAWTGVRSSSLILETGDSGVIYGNGVNQVGVRVHFIATDTYQRVVPLSPTVLGRVRISLLDYNSLGDYLPTGWAASEYAGAYHHTVPQGIAEEEVVPRTKLYGERERVFYLSCHTPSASASNVQIGSKIEIPAGGNVINRIDGTWHSAVSLEALVPVVFHKGDTLTVRENTANGWEWDQDNYYVTLTRPGHYIQHAEINEGVSGPRFWSIISKDQHPRWHFIWDFGPPSSAYFSLLNEWLSYNRQPNAVCLTRLRSDYYDSHYQNGFYQTRFTVYDQYGNTGFFSAVRDENDWGNTIRIEDGGHTSKG